MFVSTSFQHGIHVVCLHTSSDARYLIGEMIATVLLKKMSVFFYMMSFFDEEEVDHLPGTINFVPLTEVFLSKAVSLQRKNNCTVYEFTT